MNRVPLVCNLDSISAAERPRYRDLVSRLRASIWDRIDVPDGYCYRLDLSAIALSELAEWITMERLCCPFLTFQLDVQSSDTLLTLRGPEGAKAILREAFQ
jgi:hypothetical protein